MDESIPGELVEVLRKDLRANVKFASRRTDDEELIPIALKEKRILLTADLDFADRRCFPIHMMPFIVVLNPAKPVSVLKLLVCFANALNFFLEVKGEAPAPVKVRIIAGLSALTMEYRTHEGKSITETVEL